MGNLKGIVAIIPARGGSKTIIGKNLKVMNGKPLIYYTIKEALKSKQIDKVVVSTDSKPIATLSKKFGAEVIMRPATISKDNTPTLPVLKHAVLQLKKLKYYPWAVVLLQPTSPLRNYKDIDGAIFKLIKNKYNSVISVKNLEINPYGIIKIKNNKPHFVLKAKQNFLRRQDIPKYYRRNGAIYCVKTDILMKLQNHVVDYSNYGIYLMPDKRSIDIDSIFDFKLAEIIMKVKK